MTETIAGFRLSPQQTLVWSLQEDGPGPYCAACVVRVEGPLDPALLREALDRLVERHEILRMTFRRLPGMEVPLQVIGEPEAQRPALILLEEPGLEAGELLDRLVEGAVREPFDLERGPCLRALLASRSATVHLLGLILPSLCCDEAGLAGLARELGFCYAMAPAGELPQYVDLAEVFNEIAESEDTRAGRQRWAGLQASAEERLPFGGEETGTCRFSPRVAATCLERAEAAALEALAREQESSIEALLLTCWQTVLWRSNGGSPLVSAVRYGGRTFEGLENDIGLFARYLPLRPELSGEQEFDQVLRRTGAALAEAGKWQDYFVRAADGEAPTAWACAFEMSGPAPATSAGGMEWRVVARHACVDRCALRLVASADDGTIDLALHFDESRLTVLEAERVGAALKAAIAAVLTMPRVRLDSLPLLDGEALQRWPLREEGTGEPREACVHHLFEEQAARTPDGMAAVCGGVSLTFRELDRRANRLAHHLRSLGVGPEVRVGLCAPRSLEMLVGLWGILKAGGAYVPLDPRHPKERLAWMIGDARPLLVVTVESLLAGLSSLHERLVCVDGPEAAGIRDDSVVGGATPDQLAYVLYTSGSTGFPKGVMVPHRGLVNYLGWCCREYAVAEGTGAPVGSPLGFDLTVTSLFAPLLAGRAVELLGEPDGPEVIGGALRRSSGLSLVKLTPLHLDLLARSLPAEEAAGRTRAFVIGGEALNAETLAFWRRHAPETRLVNEYGPTETVVGCCFYEVPAGFPQEGPVPIGRPVAHTRLYVVDPWLQPAVAGAAGELLIAGEGVTRGYLGRPDLTAERFVPDPWSGTPGARLYRSGDLVRRRADGNLEFLGRIDHQLKIRGFRIEPGEIEAALLRHPEIREAVVTASEAEDGHKRLVAFFVPRRQPAPLAEELRSFLGRELPEHMVPGVLLPLAALPLSANGKLDRAALAKVLETGGARSEQPFVEPRTPAERILAAIWAEILRVERVGVYDNFFDLGGDSILSIQIVSRANRAGIPLAPRDVFRHQTVAALASVAGDAKAVAEQGEVTGELPLTPIQHLFFAMEPAEPHHFNQAVLLGLRRRLPRAAVVAAMRRLADHHDALRLRFTRTEQGWRQLSAPAGEIPPGTWADLSTLPEGSRRGAMEVAAAAVQGALSLGGPLGRWVCFDCGERDLPRLLLVFHHLLVDGVSWRILLEDFEALCDPVGSGVALPSKTVSYKSWAEGLVERARSESLQEELGFWLTGEASEAVPLPVDSTGGPNSVASAEAVRTSLDEEETRLLLQEVPRIYHTRIDDALLTALAQACASWTGDPSLWVDLEGHGRDALPDVDVSRTVGWFTAVHPIRLELAGGMEPGAALLSIQEQLRAVPARGTGHGLLLFLHNDEGTRRRLDALPRPQVAFNYLGQFDQVLGESSLFTPVGESAGPARAPQQDRWHLLEVTGMVVGGCLQIVWTYSRNRHSRETIEDLGQAYLAALRSLLDRCRQGAATSLDLPAGYDGEDLDRVLENVEFEV